MMLLLIIWDRILNLKAINFDFLSFYFDIVFFTARNYTLGLIRQNSLNKENF